MAYGKITDKAAFCFKFPGVIEIHEGAVRSAKTISTLMRFIRKCIDEVPAGEYALIGKTERTIYRNLIAPMEAMIGKKRCIYNRGLGILRIGGRIIHVIGANNELAVSRIQGLTLAGAYVDEATEVPEVFWNMLQTRLSAVGAWCISTCNPAGRRHWLKVNWIDKAMLWIDRFNEKHVNLDWSELGIHRYTYTLDDNPYLPTEYVERVKASFTGVWYKRFILSEWTNAEGAVYDMWDPDKHIVSVMPEMKYTYAVGIDYGTTNPTDAILLGLGVDDVLYFMDEWRHVTTPGEQSWTDKQLCDAMLDWVGDRKPTWFIVDPSAASFSAQLRHSGLKRIMAGDNKVLDGIRTVSTVMQANRLKVSEKCEHWINEAPEYAWDPKATKIGQDKPLKENDHAMDAGRYDIHSTRQYWRHLMRETTEHVAR